MAAGRSAEPAQAVRYRQESGNGAVETLAQVEFLLSTKPLDDLRFINTLVRR